LVHGAVTSPGLIRLPWNERNILYAVSAAGGFFPAGSGQVKLQPIRPDREAIVFDFSNINDVRRALSAPPLESGDVLTVQSQPSDLVFVTGLVNVPGPVAVPHDGTVSLVRTIAAAGGLRDFLDPQEATLWRVLPDGEQVRVKLDLADVLSGKVDDIALCAGDVLDVPHTAHTRFREWFAQNIVLGPFGVRAVYDPISIYQSEIGRTQVNNVNTTGQFRNALIRSLIEALIPPVPTPAGP
jgi:protein involved in polysaccharide export with SLBB domain